MMSFNMSIFPQFRLSQDGFELCNIPAFKPEWLAKNNRVWVNQGNQYYIIRTVNDNYGSKCDPIFRRIGPPEAPRNETNAYYGILQDTGWRVSDEVWNEYFECNNDIFYGVPKMREDHGIMSFRGERIKVQSDNARPEEQSCSIDDAHWIYQAGYVGPYRCAHCPDLWDSVGFPRNTLKNRIIYACRVAAAKAAARQNRRPCDDDFKGLEFPDGLVPIHNVNFFERTEP